MHKKIKQFKNKSYCNPLIIIIIITSLTPRTYYTRTCTHSDMHTHTHTHTHADAHPHSHDSQISPTRHCVQPGCVPTGKSSCARRVCVAPLPSNLAEWFAVADFDRIGIHASPICLLEAHNFQLLHVATDDKKTGRGEGGGGDMFCVAFTSHNPACFCMAKQFFIVVVYVCVCVCVLLFYYYAPCGSRYYEFLCGRKTGYLDYLNARMGVAFVLLWCVKEGGGFRLGGFT